MFTLEGGLGDHSFLSSLNLTQKPTQIHTWYLSANLEGWFKLHGIARLLRSTGISFWFYHIFTIQLKISSESRFQFLESVPDTFTSSDSPISFCEVTFMLVREPFQTQYHHPLDNNALPRKCHPIVLPLPAHRDCTGAQKQTLPSGERGQFGQTSKETKKALFIGWRKKR